MSKQTKTTAAKRGTSTTTATATVAARLKRIRAHIEKRLAEIRGIPAYIPAEWLEEIEGRPLSDVILDHIRAERGYTTKHPHGMSELRRSEDEYAEVLPTRSRNAHEKELASAAVFQALIPANNIISRADLHGLVRRFYRAGDRGIKPAIARAVKAAIAA